VAGNPGKHGTEKGTRTITPGEIETGRQVMDWKVMITGAIILGILIWLGAISIPTEVKISTNQSSTTYNLSSVSDQGLTAYNLLGLVIIVILAIVLLLWAVK